MGKLSNRRRWRENAFDTRKAARTTLTIKRFPVLTAYMNSLCERTEAIRGKAVDRRVDNMLKVSTDGRKAALDLRLVGKEQPAGERRLRNLCEYLPELRTEIQRSFLRYGH